jgi:hypothetical protein
MHPTNANALHAVIAPCVLLASWPPAAGAGAFAEVLALLAGCVAPVLACVPPGAGPGELTAAAGFMAAGCMAAGFMAAGAGAKRPGVALGKSDPLISDALKQREVPATGAGPGAAP